MSDAKVPQAPAGLNWSVKALLVTFGAFSKVTRTARDWLRKKPWMARHTRKEKEKNINQQNYPQ
jgi:hypothetical protein